MPKYPRITLSHAAFQNLLTLAITNPNLTLRPKTYIEFDGVSAIVKHGKPSAQTEHSNIISHTLNLIAQHYLPTDWTDTRPLHIIEEHDNYYSTPRDLITTIQDSRNYYQMFSPPTYRLPWFDPSSADERMRHEMALDPNAIQHYSYLARLHKMQFLNPKGMHNIISFVSAALEAIGTGYLTPPEDYASIYTPNPRRHTGTTYASTKITHANTDFHRTGYVYTPLQPITESFIEQAQQLNLTQTQTQTDYAAFHHLTDIRANMHPDLLDIILTQRSKPITQSDPNIPLQDPTHPDCIIFQTIFTQTGTTIMISGRKTALHRFVYFATRSRPNPMPHRISRTCPNYLCLQPAHLVAD